MTDFFSIEPEKLVAFMLVLTRISAMTAFMPVLGGNMPRHMKSGLAVMMTAVLYPVIDTQSVPLGIDVFDLILMVMGEAFIGVTAAFIVTLVFAGIQLGGAIIGFQIGFGIVNVIDPITNLQVSLTGQFMNLVAILLFLAMNVHHYVLIGLAETFSIVPITGVVLNRDVGDLIMHLATTIFLTGAQVAAPVSVTLLLKQAAMGLIARTVPQMNIMIVGFPLTIGIGLFALAYTLPLFIGYTANLFDDVQAQITATAGMMH